MAVFEWYGDRIMEKARTASMVAIDHTIAACVSDSKDDHPGWPPTSEPFERFASRTGFAVGSFQIFEVAHPTGPNEIHGTWGSDGNYLLFLEIGTSRVGATAEERAAAAAGDIEAIAPPEDPLMEARPWADPAMDRHYPLLAGRIAAVFRGESLG